MRILPALLTGSLLASTAFAGGLGEMTQEERNAFRAEVRAFLVENPEVLVEAMDALQAKEQQSAAQRDLALLETHADVIFNDPASWVGGNPDGDITIVEFVDYRCGYCRKAHEEVEELVKSDGNIKLVMKEFPILGEQSTLSSRFAIAVLQLHGADTYKKAHDLLITLRADATPEALTRLAQDLSLDPAPLLARMDAAEVLDVIEANHSLGTTLEISGTPTFVIDQTFVRGYVPLDGMRQIVAGQRAG